MRYFSKVVCLTVALAAAACSNSSVPIPSSAGTISPSNLKTKKVLVFSKTAGWRHDSIEAGQDMFRELASSHGFTVEFSENASIFTDKKLNPFDAIVFLNTTGDILDMRQENAMQRFIQSGGGYVGIHAATDTETDGWHWYPGLSGAAFNGHPGDPSNVQTARMMVVEGKHASTALLPKKFNFVDEWYDFKSVNLDIKPLIEIERDSYEGAKAKGHEPISWYHDYDGGRAFYTNLGHQKSTFKDPLFLDHITGGLAYAVGTQMRDKSIAYRPDSDRFKTTNLTGPLAEPLSMDVMEDGSIIFIERAGPVKRWTEAAGVEKLGTLENVYRPGEGREFGLIGVAGYPVKGPLEGVFLMYNVKPEGRVLQRVSYVPISGGALDIANIVNYIDMPNEDICCHTGGAIRFGPDGNLYIATGDNSTPFQLDGFGPLSLTDINRDARRSSGNTKDYAGKFYGLRQSSMGLTRFPKEICLQTRK